jgi:N-acetylglutamate synthase/N-acetylornithine aminotransferase
MVDPQEEERNEIRPMTRRLAQNVAATSDSEGATIATAALVKSARNRRSAFVWVVEIAAHKSRWRPST